MVNARGPVQCSRTDTSRLGTNEGGAGLEPLFELFEIRVVARLRKQASLKKKNPTTRVGLAPDRTSREESKSLLRVKALQRVRKWRLPAPYGSVSTQRAS